MSTSVSLRDFNFSQLSPDFDLTRFDCKINPECDIEEDINKFLREDALNYQSHHMANTYLFHTDYTNIAAYFCISNDCLNDKGFEDYESNVWNRINRKRQIPNDKRFRSFPSVKIGRLGVDKKYHKKGVAYELMDFIKGYVLAHSKPSCRLLILDAINKSRQLKYYENNDFDYLLNTDTDKKNENRFMYFDLKSLT